MVGAPLMPDEHMDGKSFVATLKEDGTFSRGDIFWHYPHYSNQGNQPTGTIRSGDYKLIEHYNIRGNKLTSRTDK